MFLYPYKKSTSNDFYPIVDFIIYFKKNISRTSALIDSGATISIFRPEVARSLGITIENGKEIFLGGVGGRIKGFVHDVELEVAGKKISCPVVFSNEYHVSLNLLGRAGFFDKFKIIFEEKKKQVRLES